LVFGWFSSATQEITLNPDFDLTQTSHDEQIDRIAQRFEEATKGYFPPDVPLAETPNKTDRTAKPVAAPADNEEENVW